MISYKHGGDVYSHPVRFDYSANINPLGVPQAVQELFEDASAVRACAQVYPDSACRDLVDALAGYLGIPAEHILCTGGASDFITRVCYATRPKKALLTAPCYSGYERALAATGAQLVYHMLRDEDDFAITERVLEAFEPDVDLAILCTPNNPTGLVMDIVLVEQVVQRAHENGTVLLLDESFLGFTGAPSARHLLERYPNLVIVSGFTKLFALAGLRVGFGLTANVALMEKIAAAGPEWAVSGLAQAAAIAALADGGYVARTQEQVARSRDWLRGELQALGMRVVAGRANYLLFQSERPLGPQLLEHSILIRECGNYNGLDESWYRCAVRSDEENALFIEALKEICS